MGLSSETFPGLFEVLHAALTEGITPHDENRVRLMLTDWLNKHAIEMFPIYEDRHPISFVYAHNGVTAAQIELFLSHNDSPVTIIAGRPPSSAVEMQPTDDLDDACWPAR